MLMQDKLEDLILKKITQIDKSTSLSETAKMTKLALYHALEEVVRDIILKRPVVNTF